MSYNSSNVPDIGGDLCLRLFTERESKLGTTDGDDSSPRGLRDPTESQLWDLS